MLWDKLNEWAVKQSRERTVLEDPQPVPVPDPYPSDPLPERVADWITSVISLLAWMLGYRHYANHHFKSRRTEFTQARVAGKGISYA